MLHFVAAGALLFALGLWYQRAVAVRHIVITPERLQQIDKLYTLQFGAPPSPGERVALFKDEVRQEILYREALRLGLDRDDEIIRRRLVQKAEFLLQDTATPPEPTEAQLDAYFRAHAAEYVQPPRVSFSHIYFSADDNDEATRRRARSVLPRLASGRTRAPELGDPFPDLYDFSAYESQQVERLFGDTEFTRATQTAPIGHWSGPFRSGYGWHLLRVSEREAARPLRLHEIRARVHEDYLQYGRQAANEQAYAELAGRYRVQQQP